MVLRREFLQEHQRAALGAPPGALYGPRGLGASSPSIFRAERPKSLPPARRPSLLLTAPVGAGPVLPLARSPAHTRARSRGIVVPAAQPQFEGPLGRSAPLMSEHRAAQTDTARSAFAPRVLPLDVGVQSIQGVSPYKSVNQDRWAAVRADGIELYGVFDGHGALGHRVSQFVSERLGAELIALTRDVTARQDVSAVTAALHEAHHRIERALEASAIDCTSAGCTGVCIVLLRPLEQVPSRALLQDGVASGMKQPPSPMTLIVSNVGDSRAVLGTTVPRRAQFGANGSLGGGGSVQLNAALTGAVGNLSTERAMDLSVDHKPDHPSERRRIEAAGGVVAKNAGAGAAAPFRVWDRQRRVGLATSRSFGDTYATGVTHEPDIRSEALVEGDHFVILGSDGLWDRISSPEAVRLASTAIQRGSQHAADVIAAEALRRWRALGTMSDDITVMVVRLPKP